MAKDIHLDIVKYHFDSAKDSVLINAAIAKANSMMHDMEIAILEPNLRYLLFSFKNTGVL